MLVFRFLSGVGGSAPLSIGAGVLADCFTAEDRGKGIAVYSLGPLLGPSLGPIAGEFITENTTWRWCFWATSSVCMVVHLFGLIFHKETYEPVILAAKAAKLRKETGNECLYTKYDSQRKLIGKLSTAFKRPLRLITTQPLIQVLSIYFAFLYGTIYLVLSTFATLWTRHYHQPIGIGSLNYIALGLGFIVSGQIYGFVSDKIYRNLKSKNNNVGRPEFRAPLIVVGSLLVPVGLLWYGWSAQARIHWIMPDIGAFIFAAGANIGFQGLQAYIIESYQLYAASAIAAVTVLRSLAGFGFPLFAPYMYSKLGNGWGNSVLALTAIVFGFPAPLLMWTYGAKLRAASTFAAG